MTDWTLAACKCDPEAMFATDPDEVAYARRVCADCPIRTACLCRALHGDEPWGVWGGYTPQERRDMAERARPWQRLEANGHLKPCGTSAAARRHRRRGESLCAACRAAESRDAARKQPARTERERALRAARSGVAA